MAMAECGCMIFGPDDRACAELGLGAAALRYADMGYQVLPLTRGAKRPHLMLGGSGGVHHATADPARIIGWWAEDPAANVGVATGSRSGLLVLDLDIKHGHDGPRELGEWLRSWGGQLPYPAPTARTPSGGWHVWLRTPRGFTVPERPGILDGVDAKGDGGLVVAPPSMQLLATRPGSADHPSSGGELVPVPYRWASGCPHAAPDAPPWMAHWLAHAPRRPGAGEGRYEDQAPDLGQLRRTGVPAGSRNDTLYRLACSLYRRWGTGPEASAWVADQILAVWQAGSQAGMSRGEVSTILGSARRFIEGEVTREAQAFRAWREWIG